MISRTIKRYLWAVLPALFAFALSYIVPAIDAILLGLITGVIIGNTIPLSEDNQQTANRVGSNFLEFSIVLLAFGINYQNLLNLGWQTLLVILLVVFSTLIVTYFWTKKPVNWLIGFGTAICGSSAIAALAPSVAKNKTDTGVAMAVVNLYGALGMVLLPFLFTQFQISTVDQSLWIGSSLHSVGNVAGAAYMVDTTVGEWAISIKLARVSLLSFGLIFFNLLTQKNQAHTSWSKYFRLPWYIWGFISITIVGSLLDFPNEFINISSFLGKLFLTIAMTNIGLQIRFKDLFISAKNGLSFGFLIFVFQLLVIAFLLFLM